MHSDQSNAVEGYYSSEYGSRSEGEVPSDSTATEYVNNEQALPTPVTRQVDVGDYVKGALAHLQVDRRSSLSWHEYCSVRQRIPSYSFFVSTGFVVVYEVEQTRAVFARGYKNTPLGFGERIEYLEQLSVIEGIPDDVDEIFPSAGRNFFFVCRARNALYSIGEIVGQRYVQVAKDQIPEDARIIQAGATGRSECQFVLLDSGSCFTARSYEGSEWRPIFPQDTFPKFRRLAFSSNKLTGIDQKGILWLCSWDGDSEVDHSTLVKLQPDDELFQDVILWDDFLVALSVSGQIWSSGSTIGLGRGPSPAEGELSDLIRVTEPDGITYSRLKISGWTCAALSAEGDIFAWGRSSRDFFENVERDFDVPTRLPNFAGLRFRDMELENDAVVALATDGQLYECGLVDQDSTSVQRNFAYSSYRKINIASSGTPKLEKLVVFSGGLLAISSPSLLKYGLLESLVPIVNEVAASQIMAGQAAEGYREGAVISEYSVPSYYELVAEQPVPSSDGASVLSAYFTEISAETGEETFAPSYYEYVADVSSAEDASFKKWNSAASSSTQPAGNPYDDSQEAEISADGSNEGSESESQKSNGSGRNWNAEFQSALSLPNGTLDEQVLRSKTLMTLYEDFVLKVKETAEIIVLEVSHPPQLKTIKPLNIGGIAGGEKYIHENIFFKFSIDMHGIYGGDEWSRKGALLKFLVDSETSVQASGSRCGTVF